jgi:hypothetical protein
VVDRFCSALGLGRVVREVARLVDRARQADDGDLAAAALPHGHGPGVRQVERVQPLVERAVQQGLARGAGLARGQPRGDQPGPGGLEGRRGHRPIIAEGAAEPAP